MIINQYNPNDEEHRLLLCKMLLKAADTLHAECISNITKEFEIAREWGIH